MEKKRKAFESVSVDDFTRLVLLSLFVSSASLPVSLATLQLSAFTATSPVVRLGPKYLLLIT